MWIRKLILRLFGIRCCRFQKTCSFYLSEAIQDVGDKDALLVALLPSCYRTYNEQCVTCKPYSINDICKLNTYHSGSDGLHYAMIELKRELDKSK